VSVWTDRDLPVLRAVAGPASKPARNRLLFVGGSNAREALGVELDDAVILDSLLILRDADYVHFLTEPGGGSDTFLKDFEVTGSGLQVLGEWPLFDAVASPETIDLVLEHLAPEAPTPEETTELRRAATYVRTIAPTVLQKLVVGATTALLKQHLHF
jgi:hypothetical protein